MKSIFKNPMVKIKWNHTNIKVIQNKIKTKEKKEQRTDEIKNKWQDGKVKLNNIDNYIKCKLFKHLNYNAKMIKF